MAVTVKMIKVGSRECILTHEHCIPFDVVMHVEFCLPDPTSRVPYREPPAGTSVNVGLLMNEPYEPEGWAKIYLGVQGQEPVELGLEEAKQLKKVFSVL